MNAVHGASKPVQRRAATVLAALLQQLRANGKPAVADKVAANLVTLLSPPATSPPAAIPPAATAPLTSPPAATAPAATAPVATASVTSLSDEQQHAAARIAAADGARLALRSCCVAFGDDLFDALPALWRALHDTLAASTTKLAAATTHLVAPSADAKPIADTQPTADACGVRASLLLSLTLAHSLAPRAAVRLLSVLPLLLQALTATDLPGAIPADDAAGGVDGRATSESGVAFAESDDDTRVLAARALATCCDALSDSEAPIAACGVHGAAGCVAIETALDGLLPCLQPTSLYRRSGSNPPTSGRDADSYSCDRAPAWA
jgi:hypothetical protein